MKQVGYAKKHLNWAQVELEPGDKLVLGADHTFYFTTKDGQECFTSKVNYPLLSGALFLGLLGGSYLWVTDPKWVAGAIKALKAEDGKRIKVEPFDDEAEAREYIRKNSMIEPDIVEYSSPDFWEVI